MMPKKRSTAKRVTKAPATRTITRTITSTIPSLSRHVLYWIIGALVVLAALVWMYDGLANITVEGFDITGVQGAGSEALVLTGELRVNNPSIVSVPLRQLDYDVTYKGTLLGHGSVPQTNLGARGVSVIPLTQEVRLAESSALLVDVALIGSANITVDGTASLDIPLVGSRDVRFSDTVDVGPIIIDRVKSAIGSFIDDFFTD